MKYFKILQIKFKLLNLFFLVFLMIAKKLKFSNKINNLGIISTTILPKLSIMNCCNSNSALIEVHVLKLSLKWVHNGKQICSLTSCNFNLISRIFDLVFRYQQALVQFEQNSIFVVVFQKLLVICSLFNVFSTLHFLALYSNSKSMQGTLNKYNLSQLRGEIFNLFKSIHH